MSGFLSSRRVIIGTFLAVAVASATSLIAPSRGAATSAPATVPASAPAPVTPVDPNAPIAVVGGMPINNKIFYDILMQVGGMRVFQQVYDLILVQHAMTISGIPAAGPEFQKLVDKELDRTLDTLVITSTDPKQTIDRETKLKVLQEAISRQGLTMAEFSIRMQTRAGLRAMAAGKNEVTDAEAETAWKAEYGARRTVHLIPVSGADQAATVRDLIVNKKKSPEDACNELKITQPASVIISENATNIDKVKNVAFSLKEGDLSPMTPLPAPEGATPQQVLVLVDKIDADRTGPNPYTAKMKEDTLKKVKDAKEEQWINNHLQTLRADPTVQTTINDPYLSYQFALIKQQMQAQAAAATQPAATPAGTGTTPVAPAATRGASLGPIGPMPAAPK